MGAHCRIEPRPMHQKRAALAVQREELGNLAAMALAFSVFGTAFSALIRQRMTAGNDLRNRGDNTRAQATAAYDQVAEAIQQTVAHIVFRGGSHDSSPKTKSCCGSCGRLWPANAT